DLGRWFTWDRNEKGRPDLDALWEPDLECVWMPVYLRVDSLPANIVTEICLASAALPFGIVPPVEVNGVSYVDGGVVDNVPLHPFVEEFPLDEVFVVLLDSFKSDAAARKDARLTVSNWSKRQRAIEVCKFPHPAAVQPFSWHLDLPYSIKN